MAATAERSVLKTFMRQWKLEPVWWSTCASRMSSRSGRIPGATNLPLSSFDPEDLPKGKPIVLVCQAGARSARALQVAVAAGVTDIRHYPGGTGTWRTNGGDLEV